MPPELHWQSQGIPSSPPELASRILEAVGRREIAKVATGPGATLPNAGRPWPKGWEVRTESRNFPRGFAGDGR